MQSLRYEMVELAVQENEYFSISDIEVKNSDISYTVDTISNLEGKLDGKILFYNWFRHSFSIKDLEKDRSFI